MAIAYHRYAIAFPPRVHVRSRSRREHAPNLTLPTGEHPLLRESGPADDARYVATEKALYRRGAHDSIWDRIAWVDLALAESSRTGHVLVLRRWPGDQQPTTELTVAARSRIPAFARERIAACQILIRHVRLDGTRVVITALREPGTDTTIWTAHLDQRSEPGHPDPAAVDRAVREIRAQAGC